MFSAKRAGNLYIEVKQIRDAYTLPFLFDFYFPNNQWPFACTSVKQDTEMPKLTQSYYYNY